MQVQAIAAIASLGIFLFAGTPAIADDNPLAPAEQGKIACYKPKAEAKTCWALIKYKKLDAESYETSSRVRFHNTADYEIRSTSTATLKSNRICTTFGKSDIEHARFFHLGDEVIKQDLDDLRANVTEQLKEKFDKEFCDELGAPAADGMIKVTTYIDGVAALPGTQMETLIWVTPEDGYKLR